jgi:GTP-binding protein Era
LTKVHRRAELAPWLRDMQQRHAFNEFVPMSAKNAKDVDATVHHLREIPAPAGVVVCRGRADRSQRKVPGQRNGARESCFAFTGDELPYTSTVVIDKFEEEPSPKHGRMVRIAATIVVEREGHKAMVIGEGGERLKRIGTETRTELEKLMGAKVFMELWVKVRSGWADDEARVRSVMNMSNAWCQVAC